jgi:hypothetical protein
MFFSPGKVKASITMMPSFYKPDRVLIRPLHSSKFIRYTSALFG